MKRLFLIFGTVLFICILLSACGKSTVSESSPDVQEEDDSVQHLLSDWFDYLFACENLYSDMQWAVSYVDGFLETSSWENLLKARMALSTAKRYIEQREKPDESMTAETYDKFLRQGMDVAFTHSEISTFPQGKQSALTSCLVLQYGLSQDVFGSRERENLARYTDVLQQEYIQELRYLALTTDYLLLTLGDGTWTQKFRSFTTENCPLIAAEQTEFTDPDLLYEQASAALNEIEALRAQQNEQLGSARAGLNRFKDALEQNSLEALAANSAPIDGLPLVLPYPDWYDIENAEYYFYWNNSDGSRTYPVERDVLSEPPDGCVVTCFNVSREELLAYQDALSAMGLHSLYTNEEEGSYTVYYETAGSTFVFTWEDDTVQIFMMEQPICLAPIWYSPQFVF